jgi:hypothetical protein
MYFQSNSGKGLCSRHNAQQRNPINNIPAHIILNTSMMDPESSIYLPAPSESPLKIEQKPKPII